MKELSYGVTTEAPQQEGKPQRPTVGEVAARVSDQLGRILQGEIQLIKVQLVNKLKNIGIGTGLFVAAGVFAFFSVGVLLAAAVLGLAVVLPAWLSALIIGVVLLLIALIAVLIGKSIAQKGKMPSGEETMGNIKKDVDAIKKGISS